MTRQELTERLRRSRGMSDYENQTGDREAVAALDALYAEIDALRAELRRCVEHLRSSVADEEARQREIDALRRLPVIRTCGGCRWCHPTEVCAHARAHIEQEIDGSDRTPPEWCPLRGGAK